MSKKNKMVPTLRFPGFTDAWEERKLGEILALLKDGTHGTHKDVNEGVYLLSAKNIKNGQILIDKTDRKISEKEYKVIHKNFSLEKGDVLLTIVGSIGECAVLDNPAGITFQRSVAYLRPNNNINSEFLYTTINSGKFQRELKTRQVTSAQPGIYLGNLSVIPIQTPLVDEQIKIGLFFKQLDALITLHQRKLGHLQDRKKALLQQLFPKNGETVPQLRFPGFTKEWNERKLGDLCDIMSGCAGDISLNTGAYNVTRIETISNGVIDENKVGFLNEKPKIQFLLNIGDILFSHINSLAHIGKVAIYQSENALYHGINLLRIIPNVKIDSWFLYYQFVTENKKNWSKAHANKAVNQASINQTALSEQLFSVPQVEEQQLIGNFFKQVDDSIVLQQQKLSHLQEQKKSLLQQLFI